MPLASIGIPPLIARPFRDDTDFWRVRDLLIATYPITPTQFNWDIRLEIGFLLSLAI